ncbi:MAG: hypothetical protein ABIN36_15550, partial [Ferruginibacter sp.]
MFPSDQVNCPLLLSVAFPPIDPSALVDFDEIAFGPKIILLLHEPDLQSIPPFTSNVPAPPTTPLVKRKLLTFAGVAASAVIP